MNDSLRTAVQGMGGILLSFWEVLPGVLRICILLATLVHIIIKIWRDLTEEK